MCFCASETPKERLTECFVSYDLFPEEKITPKVRPRKDTVLISEGPQGSLTELRGAKEAACPGYFHVVFAQA